MDDLRGVRIGVIGAGAIGGALIERLLSGAGSSAADIVLDHCTNVSAGTNQRLILKRTDAS